MTVRVLIRFVSMAMATLCVGGCLVQVDPFARVYACESNDDCADGWVCFRGANGSFCARRCESGCDEERGEVCTGDVCLEACDAPTCREGLECVLTESAGYCSTGFTCSNNADCGSTAGLPFDALDSNFCLSSLAPVGNSCVFTCADDGNCPDGQTCAGFLGSLPTCAPPCTDTGGCPPGYTCADAPGAFFDGFCLPGLPPLECAGDTDCLVGTCSELTADGTTVCSVPCSAPADCDPFEGPIVRDLDCLPNVAGDGVCASVFQACGDVTCGVLQNEICATIIGLYADSSCIRACSNTAGIGCGGEGECITVVPAMGGFNDFGLCLQPCIGPGQCTRANWGCNLSVNGFFIDHCVPGVPGINCVDAADCLPGSECLEVFGPGNGRTCMFPCNTSADCAQVEADPSQPIYDCTLPFGGNFYCQP